ncbi:MAG: hypothetical protein D6820_03450, partial [Lentisphaerae bacterium]
MRHLTLPFLLCALIIELMPAVSAAESPLFHWTMDAPKGVDVQDTTGHGYPGILLQGHHQHPLPSRHPDAGIRGGAVRIESRSIIRAQRIHPVGSAWTLSFWIHQDDRYTSVHRLLVLPGLDFWMDSDNVRVVFSGLGTLTGKRITPERWEHILIRVEPGEVTLYINGFPAAKKTKASWHYPHAGARLEFGATDWHR